MFLIAARKRSSSGDKSSRQPIAILKRGLPLMMMTTEMKAVKAWGVGSLGSELGFANFAKTKKFKCAFFFSRVINRKYTYLP